LPAFRHLREVETKTLIDQGSGNEEQERGWCSGNERDEARVSQTTERTAERSGVAKSRNRLSEPLEQRSRRRSRLACHRREALAKHGEHMPGSPAPRQDATLLSLAHGENEISVVANPTGVDWAATDARSMSTERLQNEAFPTHVIATSGERCSGDRAVQPVIAS